jgi:hypothetical protein
MSIVSWGASSGDPSPVATLSDLRLTVALPRIGGKRTRGFIDVFTT